MSDFEVKRQVLNQADLSRISISTTFGFIPGCLRHNYWSLGRCKRCLYHLFPCLELIQEYNCKRDLYPDILAGLTIGFIQIPQSLAYAYLAEVAPICGLYTAFFSSILYFFFGSSKQANTGTFSIVCLLAGDVIKPHTYNIEYDNAKIMASICLVVGIYQFIFFLLNFGKLCEWLSDTLINSFSIACSFHIISSQIPNILGHEIDATNGYFRIYYICVQCYKNIKKTNYVTFLFSLCCLVVLFANNFGLKPYLSKKTPIQVPLELFLLLLGILCQYLLDLKVNYGVLLLADIPKGFAGPIIPTFEYMKLVAVEAITIAVVAYIISASICLYFSKKGSYEVRPNQEALALSIMNIVGAFFFCVPTSISLVRTMIAFNLNAMSQFTGIFSCIILLAVILWGAYFVCLLPKCVIASIIVACAVGTLKEIKVLKFYWKISKTDLITWLITFGFVAFIDITLGLGVGIGISILTIVYRSFRTDSHLLGVIPKTEIYLDLRKYPHTQEIPMIKIFRFSGGVNFVTRQMFRKGLSRTTGVSPKRILIQRTKAQRKLKPGETLPELVYDFKIIVVDCSAINNIDYQGVEHVKAVVAGYKKIGITVLMASPHGNIYETFLHLKKVEHYEEQCLFFATIHDAVIYSKSLLKNIEPSTS